MPSQLAMVDIHCHLLPGIDDGAADWDETLAMARMAAADGLRTIVATPHQLGNFAHNGGDTIRRLAGEADRRLRAEGIPLKVLPGADVRIEEGLTAAVRRGDVVSLADRGRHVLLELPHEIYVPLEGLLDELRRAGITGILSHPERNGGIQREPGLVRRLVEAGCLMQVTAGSLCGTFGPDVAALSERLVGEGLVHFVSTDAHGMQSRRPLLGRAYHRLAELGGEELAVAACCRNPAAVVTGDAVDTAPRPRLRRGRVWPWSRKVAG